MINNFLKTVTSNRSNKQLTDATLQEKRISRGGRGGSALGSRPRIAMRPARHMHVDWTRVSSRRLQRRSSGVSATEEPAMGNAPTVAAAAAAAAGSASPPRLSDLRATCRRAACRDASTVFGFGLAGGQRRALTNWFN